MLNNINGKDGIGNNPLIQQQEMQSIEKIAGKTNPYAKSNELVDQSEISKEAQELFERDKDIEKFKSIVLSSLDSSEGTDEVAKLIMSGKYEITDDQLADSLSEDSDLIDYLF